MTEPRQSQTSAAPEKKAVLPRTLSDFLIEMAITLNKYAIYPDDHPALAPAANSVADRVGAILQEKKRLALGVADQQLVIEGVATDPTNPVLAELAGRFHRHHLGALLFTEGVSAEEIDDAFSLIATEADRGQPLGLGPADQLEAWSNLRLYPLTFDRLELAEDGFKQEQGHDGEAKESSGRSAQLWLGLARAALWSEDAEDTGAEKELTDEDIDPSAVAAAIDAQEGAAYEQVVVGYLMKIAEELKSAPGNEAKALRTRTARLMSELNEDTVKRLLHMGGDVVQRKEFLMTAAEGMAADAVVKLVENAADQENQNISNSMLRMLDKMSKHAVLDRGRRRQQADDQLRDQMTSLIEGWTLTDPNPDAYTLALQQMSTAAPAFKVAPEAVFRPEPSRIVEMALEVDVEGAPVTLAVNTLVEEGGISELMDRLAESEDSDLAGKIWAELSSAETLRTFLQLEPLDVRSLDRLIERFGELTVDAMLDVLTDADSKVTRRALIDRLVSMGTLVGPQVVARLRDERWFVQRNMLNIIAHMKEIPAEFPAAEFMQAKDTRVRREALTILFNHPALRERAICQAVSDDDHRTVYAGLSAASRNCPRTAIPLIVARVTDSADDDVQVAAVKVLGSVKSKVAVEALLRVIEPRRSLFMAKLPPKTPGYLAALRASQAMADDPRVRKALARAAGSKDPEVARAATTPFTSEADVETN